MYNRYIRNDSGTYSRIPAQEPAPSQQNTSSSPQRSTPGALPTHSTAHTKAGPTASAPKESPPPPGPQPVVEKTVDSVTGILRHVLDQLHLDRVDTGDLLLLGLLFFLFREEADDELLVALGLLLIL